jgi:hypothetical protein
MQTDSETEPEQDPDVAIYDEPFPIVDVNNAESRVLPDPPGREPPGDKTGNG